MRIRLGALAAVAVFVVGCDNATTSPRVDESAVLAFDQAATMDSASFVPRGPMYDGEMPDSIKLTDDQKVAIKALHDAFAAAHKAQFDQLAAIHGEARAAFKAGKTRTDIAAILQKSRPIMEAMRPDFEALRVAVGAILTPAQKAWAAAHQRMGPGPMGGPMPGRRP